MPENIFEIQQSKWRISYRNDWKKLTSPLKQNIFPSRSWGWTMGLLPLSRSSDAKNSKARPDLSRSSIPCRRSTSLLSFSWSTCSRKVFITFWASGPILLFAMGTHHMFKIGSICCRKLCWTNHEQNWQVAVSGTDQMRLNRIHNRLRRACRQCIGHRRRSRTYR